MKKRKQHEDVVLFLRTCKYGGASYGEFKWNLEIGSVTCCPDWSPLKACGNGLHGLPWGEGDGSLLDWGRDAVWVVFGAPASTVVDIDGSKSKVPKAVVVHVGDQKSATDFIAANGGAGRAIAGGTATARDGGTATAGYRGTATAGYRGTATAGYGGTATAGDGGIATAGDGGTATAGNGGSVVVKYWDYDLQRWRIAAADVGFDGIKPNTPYHVVNGKLVENK